MFPILAPLLSLAALGPASPGPCGITATPVSQDALATLVANDDAFASRLYAQLQSTPGNIVVSPLSLSTTLSMTLAGARGDTAKEIHSALQSTLPDQTLADAKATLLKEIGCRPGVDYELTSADALWGQTGYGLAEAFKQVLAQDYGAVYRTVDFQGAPAEARKTINDWAAAQTHDRIKSLLPDTYGLRDTRLVLTNALYYKGSWVNGFDPNKTTARDFRLSDGTTAQVPTMERYFEDLLYHEFPEYSAVAMPLVKKLDTNDVAQDLIVVLPHDRNGLAAVEKSLTDRPESLQAAVDELFKWYEVQVHVQLPKFTIRSRYALKSMLAGLGIDLAFDPGRADLSGITGNPADHLFVEQVFQQGYLDVNEKGIEAAAASAVTAGPGAAPQWEEFTADHPFLYVLVDHDTKAILFLGRIVDPRG